MKLIEADKLKKSIRRNDGYGSWNESDVLCAIDREPEVLLSCPKCHGIGKYEVYQYDEEIPCIKVAEELHKCELCHGTGKVTVEFYEEIQKASREK